MNIPSKFKNLSGNKARQLFQDAYRSSKHKYTTLSEARHWLPTSEYGNVIAWILRQKFIPEYLNPKCADLSLLGAWYPLLPVSYRREIEWAKSLVLLHKNEIRDYLSMRAKFEHAILTDQFSEAQTILSNIFERLGPSFWWIKNSISLLQLYKGLEAQKMFSSEIKSKFQSQSMQEYIVHQISIRNEPSITPSKFLKQLSEEIDAWPFDNDYKHMASYHISGEFDFSIEAAADILRFSMSECIVDTYEALIHGIRVLSVHNDSEKDIILGTKILANLLQSFDDKRLVSLELVYGNSTSENLEILKPDSETTGSLANLLNKAQFDKTQINASNTIDRLKIYLNNILSKSKDTDISGVEMERLAMAFPTFSLFDAVRAISLQELNPDYRYHSVPLSDSQARDYYRVDKKSHFLLSIGLEISPVLLPYMPNKLRDLLSHLIEKSFGQLVTVPSAYVLESKKFSRCTSLLKLGIYDKALQYANSLWTESENDVYKILGLKYRLACLTAQKSIDIAIELAVEEYTKNQSIRHVFSIRDLTDSIDKDLRKKLSHSLSVSIMFDIYSRHIDGAYTSTLRRSVADVLRKNGLNKPSQLMGIQSKFTKNTLVYFLRYCCVPENIYVTGAFQNTTSLLDERMLVLRILSEYDEQNSEIYENEIYERTRRIVIEARRAEVEQSKVELSFDGFLRTAEKRVKESYERYLAYINIRIPQTSNNEVSLNSTSPSLPKALPENEHTNLLSTIIADLLDIFLYDKYFGLDGVLGTRIRHNVLESELRSPLVSNNLTTSRNSEGTYNFNYHWLTSLLYTKRELAVEINEILSLFARDYDELLLEIKNDWIQIKKQNQENGLINVSTEQVNIELLEHIIREADSPLFQIFAESVFTIFNNLLEPSLTLVREKLETVGKSNSIKLLSKLERELRDKNELPDGLIDEVMNARASILRAFDRVIAWFKPSYENSSEPIKFEDVVQICVEIVQRYHPNFLAELQLSETANILIPGILIRGLTDIFIIVFDNAIRRSGIRYNSNIKISAITTDLFVRVTVTNEFSPNLSIHLIRDKINTILNNILHKSYRDLLKSDSGTGIYRLYDSIVNVLKIDPDILIEVSEDRKFTISFNLPAKYLL